MKIFISILLLLSLSLCACSAPRYTSGLSCEEITSALYESLLDSQLYAKYSETDVRHKFSDTELYGDASVVYSISSDDISEVGVLKAKETQSTDELLDEVLDYIEDLKDEKQEFLKSYLPSELNKLNFAEARAFGPYVVYTVLGADNAEEVFSFAKELLSE